MDDEDEPMKLRGDGECWTGAFISRDGTPEEECTLRAAFQEANARAGLQRVHFNIPGEPEVEHVIDPATPLPALTDPIWIDGYMQPGAIRAEFFLEASLRIGLSGTHFISGSGANGSSSEISGILLGEGSGGSRVSGLVISRFPKSGIQVASDGNILEGNHIGTDFFNPGSTGNVTGPTA